jgi:hypothetical protein
MGLVEVAFKDYGMWKCSISKNRDGLRDALEKVKNFRGVAGELSFDENHSKECVIIARVDSTFSYTYNSVSCPK